MHLLVITNTVLTGFLTLVMAFFYLSHRTYSGFRQWTMGSGLIALTFLMLVLRGLVPTSLAIIIQNFLYSLAPVLYLDGTRSFLGLSSMSRGWYAVPAATATFSVLSLYFFDSAAWRALIGALAFSAPHMVTAILIFKDYFKAKSLFSLVLGAEMALTCALLLVWAIWSFTIPDFQLLMATPIHAGFFISVLVLQIVITISFLMLNVERATRDLVSTQDALKFSEEKYSKAFHSTPDSIAISRITDGRLVEVNEAFSTISGYSRDEALSQSSIDLNVWANEQDREKIVNILRDKTRVQDQEITFKNKSGKILDCLFSAETLLLNGEECVLSVIRDISERKRWEQELRDTLERFYSILSNSFAGLLLVTNEGIVEFVNQAMCDLFDIDDPPESLKGLTAPEMIGKLTNVYENPQETHARIKDIVAQNKSLKGEEVAARGSRTYLVDYVPIVIAGKPYGRLWHHTDITHLKKAEQERENLRSQLLQSQKMEAVGTLAAGIAHDFNNMLQVILGYSDMLLGEKRTGEPGHAELQKIVKTAVEARDLVQKIRLFSRKADIQPVAVDLNHQLTELTKLLSHTLLKTIDIDVHLGENLDLIKADPALMDQMVTNLAINASEAMPDGGTLTLRTQNIMLDDDFCKLHPGANPGPHVLLTVSDTGRGMSKELTDKIFEPFFSTKQRDYHRGTGLGLSVVKGIVDEHRGYITVHSEVGKGATFTIYFPSLETREVLRLAPKIDVAATGGETILLVEDEELVRELGIRLLERFGYKVIAVCDGQEAVEVYAKEQKSIALVILDIVMPRMNGKECLQELLKMNPEVKVLISSGVAQEDRVKEVVDLGARGALLKPYSMKTLQDKVREVLDSDS